MDLCYFMCAVTVAATPNDTTQYVTDLRDVEVVGVKQLPSGALELRSTIDAAEINDYRLDGVRAVSTLAPNFFMPAYGSRMTSSIYVRGLGARIDQPVVGLSIDNIPYLNKDAYDFSMADIASIEVLRGSAAVLNGRNAMAGQINIRTLSPWDYEGLRLEASYGRANTAQVSAGWYGRLTERLATSLTASFNNTDGFFRNEYDDSHCGRERQGGARWKLSWHPHTRWSLSNTASMSLSRQDGYPYESLASGRIAYGDTTFYRRTSLADALTVSYTGRRMIATLIASAQYLDDNMTLDQDFLPEDYFTLTQKRREWAVTGDLFAKGTRGVYDWLIGVFSFYRRPDISSPVTFRDTGISRLIEDNVNSRLPKGMELRWDSRRLLLGSDFNQHNGGFALYHQSQVTLGDWTLQGGLRWDIERISMYYNSNCDASATMGRLLPGGRWMPIASRPVKIDKTGYMRQTFNELIPQLTVRYSPDSRVSLQVSAAKGYKTGGYNIQMFSDILQQQLMESMGVPAKYDIEKILTYKPEKSWTYELTASANTADRRLTAQLTGFLMTCRDQQLTVFPGGNVTGRAMTNAGRTRSYGIEAVLKASPAEGLDINASYGWTHATFTRYNNGLTDLKGKRLPYAPAHTLFIGAEYRLPWSFAGLTPSVGADVRGAGDIMWNDENTERQKFYATLGANIKLSHKHFDVSLWGLNLTDTRYSTFYFESIGNRFVQRANPWSLGATLRVFLHHGDK